MSEGNFEDRPFWQLLIWAALLGVIASIGIMLYILAVNLVKGWIWPEMSYDPFTMPVWIVGLFTVSGLLVGLLYHLRDIKEGGLMEMISSPHMDHASLPWQLLNGFITLIGGFSLGPETPAILVAGGANSWVMEKKRFSEDDSRDVFTASVSGSFGGLFSSPFVGVMMALEMSNPSRKEFTRALALDSIAAVTGFALFYSLVGMNPEIGYINLPSYDFQTWHLLVGIMLGVLGAGVGLVFGASMRFMKRIMRPLEDRPLIRCTMVGFLLGLLAFTIPLTLFFGLEQLEHVFEFASAIGIVMLILAIIARILATTGALASGFIGGPIFPTFFIGGTLGSILTILFPELPIALTAGALAAAIPAAILPIPLSISIFAILFLGLSTGDIVPVLTAGVTSYVLIQGIRSMRKDGGKGSGTDQV
jgi:H+/Cl- antiporter ClcA